MSKRAKATYRTESFGSLGRYWYIARQDKSVVEKQLPRRSDLHMDEHLVPGDGPIILYRRRRRALLDAAGIPEKR